MTSWWRDLGFRQRAALVLYAGALALLVGSLFMVFFVHADLGLVLSTSEVIGNLVETVWGSPDFFRAESWEEFVRGPLSALGFGLCHLLVLPGGYFLVLSTRSPLFCWMGRLIWSLLLLIGPVLLIVGEEFVHLSTGFWAWSGWVFLIVVAQFVVTPVRANPGGFPPSQGSAPRG